jgi:hypothetical protein
VDSISSNKPEGIFQTRSLFLRLFETAISKAAFFFYRMDFFRESFLSKESFSFLLLLIDKMRIRYFILQSISSIYKMDKIFFLQISTPTSGLCNQIYAIVGSILRSQQEGKKIIIIDNFLTEIGTNQYAPISTILDLEKTNQYMLQKHGVYLIDRNQIPFQFVSAKLGNEDVTQIFQQRFVQKEKYKIHFPKNTIFSQLSFNNHSTTLTIQYRIGKIQFENILYSNHPNDFDLDLLSKDEMIYQGKWRTDKNAQTFNDVLFHMVFHSSLQKKADELFKQIYQTYQTNKIHVAHLRIEEDAIQHWAKDNHIYPDIFRSLLYRKYINMISKEVPKNEPLLLLCYDTQNPVIDFLQQHQYNFFILQKNKEYGREINGIMDILVSQKCNGKFFGVSASTFSQTVFVRNPHKTTGYFFNIHVIDHDYYVWENY